MTDTSLWFGDCMDIMKDLPDDVVDMILCDLPYGITKNKWDCGLPLNELWEHYCRLIKKNGAIVLFAGGGFTSSLIESNKKLWRYNLIWRKTTPTGFLNANRQPLRVHEDICVFYGKQPTYNPQKTIGHERKVSTAHHKRNCKKSSDYGEYNYSSYDSTERFPTSVLDFATDKQKSSLHPTQKPVALLEYLIKTYTNPGDTVLDNCMGSGSTGVACVNTERHFIGIEADRGYFDVATKRIVGAKMGGEADV